MKIQIRPQKFVIAGIGQEQLADVMYIDPEKVESQTELKNEQLWILHMTSGNLIAITREEYLKFAHLF